MISPKIFKWIDLTHELSEVIPTWDGNCGFKHADVVTYEDCKTDCKFLIQQIKMSAGIGTHMDAPAHCFPRAKTIVDLSLENLISPCVVVDVSAKAHEQYSIDIQAIENFEKQYGKVWRDSFVIFYTGWDRFWKESKKYHNNYKFPTISKQVAEYLVSENIVGVGIDTLSPDAPESGYPVHQIILGSNKYIVENIANANLMPATEGYVFVLPIPIVNGTEAPVRLLGCFQNTEYPIL